MKKTLLYMILFSLLVPAALQALSPVVIDENTESVSLGRYMEILEDPSGKLTIDDVTKPEMQDRWFQSNRDVPNFGFTDKTYWFHFLIKPDEVNRKHCSNYIMVQSWPLTDLMEVYFTDSKGVRTRIVTGDKLPLATRERRHRKFIFNLPLNREILSVHIKLKSKDTVQLHLSIWQNDKFNIHDRGEICLLGGFFGILFIMILYNFLIFITVKDTSYLYYILYILSQLCYNLLYSGFGVEIFGFDYPDLINLIFPVSVSAVTIGGLVFVRNFLNTAETQPRLDYLFLTVIFISIINMLLPFVDLIIFSIAFQNLLVIIGAGLIIVASAKLFFVHRSVKILLLSWLILLSGACVVIFKNYGLIDSNFITDNYVYLATILEIILLSFVLADRINIMKKEKEEAQSEALIIQKEATETLELKVTERTSELAEANEKLKDLDRAKTDFFSNVSHELRTPLTLILAPIDEALKGRLPEPDTFEMMQRNGRHLLSLINDLLDVSKISAGKMKLNVSEIDLCEAVRGYCAEIESAAKLLDIVVSCALPDNPVTAYIDPENFARIISNLFSNSLKFTSAGGEIVIALEKDGGSIKLTFSDTGEGIPSAKIESIFDRFSQADTSTTRNVEGTGIGLAIVEELVQLHGGTISVVSRYLSEFPENHGTEFIVTIPAGREHLTDRKDVVFSNQGNTVSNMPFVRGISGFEYKQEESGHESSCLSLADDVQTILIVEDNSDMSHLLESLLSQRYKTFRAANGIEALDILEENSEIDIILSDIMMPRMDGHELLRRIRSDERFEGLPVLFLTARADDFMKLEGLELGAIDYVTKPFNSDELKLRIKNQMDLRVLRNNLQRKNRELEAELSEKISKRKPEVTESVEHKLEEVCLFIKDNYRESLNRDILSSSAEMNPDTFSRMFNSYAGCTLADYVNRLRVDDAKRRLAESDLTVTRIYIESGFDSLRTFNRAFKKNTGQSPAEYREGAGLRN